MDLKPSERWMAIAGVAVLSLIAVAGFAIAACDRATMPWLNTQPRLLPDAHSPEEAQRLKSQAW